jgi:hypothetical protein
VPPPVAHGHDQLLDVLVVVAGGEQQPLAGHIPQAG